MKVRLIPASGPDLGELEFTGDLFSIGRQDPPFSDYPEDLAGGISRRHARLFIQNGELYLADLRSRNGSTVNGVMVQDLPLPVANGDVIGFAGELFYKVEITQEGHGNNAPRKAQEVRLFLTPVSKERGIEPIVIMDFPFLVGKDDEVFARYKGVFTEEVNFLSRRHAYIHISENNIVIEDLGSTNGTFVNGKLLEDETCKIHSGDEVSFGGDFFTYVAVVETQGESQNKRDLVAGGPAPASSQDTSKTTFVTSATSFLDIFCLDEAQVANNAGAVEGGGKEAAVTADKSVSEQRSILGLKVPDLRTLLVDQRGRYKRQYLIATMIMVVGVASVAGWYVHSGEKRKIEAACASGLHKQCVRLAGEYLSRAGNDTNIQDIAFRAFLKGYLPEWVNAIDVGNFKAAERLRQEGEVDGVRIKGSDSTLQLMDRIERLEKFIFDHEGRQGKIKIDQDEAVIESIIASWVSKKDLDRRLMIRMIENVPQFEQVRVRVLGGLRQLKNDKSLYLSAIQEFRTQLVSSLQEGGARRLAEVLDNFESRYPRISGLDKYRDDIEVYERFRRAAREENILERIEVLEGLEFKTPLFRKTAEKGLAELLPPIELRREFRLALDHWRQGDFETSASTLEAIRGKKWADYAQKELGRQQVILQKYRRLQRGRGDSGFEDKVISFYASLDQQLDQYFIQVIQSDLLKNRELAQLRANQYLKKASKDWLLYKEKGRISSLDRLEERISQHYRQQAKKLAGAFWNTSKATLIYQKLGLKMAKENHELIEAVSREMDIQKSAMNSLKSIQNDALLQSKLRLLSVDDSGE